MRRRICMMFVIASVSLALAARAEPPPDSLLAWGEPGPEPGQFSDLYMIAVGADGSVYAPDGAESRIQKFDANGNYITQWGTWGTGNGEFGFFISGIATDPLDNVYVCDPDNFRVQKFDANGNYLAQFGSAGSGDGEFGFLEGIAVDAAGEVYVCDVDNYRIQVFDSDGAFLRKWGSMGSANGQFTYVFDVAVDGLGNVYVTDGGLDRVQKFDSNGNFISKWGVPGGPGFASPLGLAVDPTGDVYVCDGANARVQKFDASGNYLSEWGNPGSPGELLGPNGIAISAQNEIHVTDVATFTVNKYGYAGEPTLASVVDVPGDQGRVVRLTLAASMREIVGLLPTIVQYESFRRIDPLTKPNPGSTAASEADAVALEVMLEQARADGMISDASILSQGWVFTGAVPAHGDLQYEALSATLADSTEVAGIYWSVFFVRAATVEPLVFYDSNVDSGYSLDNLPPETPQGFSASATNGADVLLTWEQNTDPDVQWYVLHRGVVDDFTPSEENLIAQETGTEYVDAAALNLGVPLYYKLIAADFAGNASGIASAALLPTGAEMPGAQPQRVAFYLQAANPIRGPTQIIYELPKATPVRLAVYDVRGRVVREVLRGQPVPAGRHAWVWDACDSRGQPVQSGVYFHRLLTPTESRTLKVLVLKKRED